MPQVVFEGYYSFFPASVYVFVCGVVWCGVGGSDGSDGMQVCTFMLSYFNLTDAIHVNGKSLFLNLGFWGKETTSVHIASDSNQEKKCCQ